MHVLRPWRAWPARPRRARCRRRRSRRYWGRPRRCSRTGPGASSSKLTVLSARSVVLAKPDIEMLPVLLATRYASAGPASITRLLRKRDARADAVPAVAGLVDHHPCRAASWDGRGRLPPGRRRRCTGRTTARSRRGRGGWPGRCRGWGSAPHDRVATLAWNSHRHLELYYAVSGMGAVIHTVNPRLVAGRHRLHPERRRQRRALRRPQLRAAARDDRGRASRRVRAVVMLAEAAEMPEVTLAPGQTLLCYETLLAEAGEDFAWPELDERAGQLALLHVGHDRAAEGRALQPSQHADPRLRDQHGRRVRPARDGPGAAGGADVPRQRLGRAVLLRRWPGRA